MTEIVRQIQKLKEEKDVLILAHYYVDEEVQRKSRRGEGKSHFVLRRVLYGGKREDPESGQTGADAGQRGGLSYGPHGDSGKDPQSKRRIRGSGGRMLYQFYRGAETVFRCMCDIFQCNEDRKRAA